VNVVICTAHDPNYQALADITRPTLERYVEQHGYDFLYDPNRDDKDACKAALFSEAFATGRYTRDDVFCWFDTDAAILNPHRRIESIVYEHMPSNVHYLIGTDPNGLNTGVFIARLSAEALLFITVATAISAASGWADQEGLIQTAVKSPHKDIYKEIPGKVFNCNDYGIKGWDRYGEYGNYINRYERGDFVLHLAGVEEPLRSDYLRAIIRDTY
jgi:hypothetical protein